MPCPKCGFVQDSGAECRRCGIVFEKYRALQLALLNQDRLDGANDCSRPLVSRLRRGYRIFRWSALTGLVLTLVLIMRPSPSPRIEVTPDSLQSAEAKVREFRESAQKGRADTLEMDEPELNSWLEANLTLAKSARQAPATTVRTLESTVELAKKAAAPLAAAPSQQDIQSSVRDVKIELGDDTLRAHIDFSAYGTSMSLELEGRLLVRDGYMLLEPTSGKLGSFPLLSGTLEAAARRLFESPENKEKFRLPPEIQDIRIDQGRLIVSSR